MRPLRAVVVLLLVAACAAPAAGAAPASRAAAAQLYERIRDAARVPAGWTGSEYGCKVGHESRRSIAATRTTVNALRGFAGLRPVRFTAALNRKALAAALMMRAAGELTHSPAQGWPCYSAAGAAGSGRSNLILSSGAKAVLSYASDAGVTGLGHRRWLLDPLGSRWGTGSTGASNALLVVGHSRSGSAPGIVAWPPPGFLPWRLVFDDWSASFADVSGGLSGARVQVTVDGEARPVSAVTDLGVGFGTGRALSWKVGLTAADRRSARTIAVRIDVPGGGSHSYSLEAFPTS